MTSRGRHPKKEVEEALGEAEAAGWSVRATKAGHKWGTAKCGSGCSEFVWSTPRSPGNHAKRIRGAVRNCPHRGDEGDE